MPVYKITITRMSGKNKNCLVTFVRKSLDVVLEIAKKEIAKGDKVEIIMY